MVERYAAAFLGFGFVAVVLTAGLTTALGAAAGAVATYGAVAWRQRRRLDRYTEEFMNGSASRGRDDRREQTRRRSRRAA